jgi:hypothetical protein
VIWIPLVILILLSAALLWLVAIDLFERKCLVIKTQALTDAVAANTAAVQSLNDKLAAGETLAQQAVDAAAAQIAANTAAINAIVTPQ